MIGDNQPAVASARSDNESVKVSPFTRIIDISRELLTTPPYPGDPWPQAKRVCSMERGDMYNLTSLAMSAHNATHVDAPLHFIDGGADVAAIAADVFVGRCVVIEHGSDITSADVDMLPGDCERVLFKGRGVVTEEAARRMVHCGIRLVGVESQSVGPAEAPAAVHRILLGAGIVLLEGLDLKNAQEGEYVLLAQPLKIAGSDGAPCRALLAVMSAD